MNKRKLQLVGFVLTIFFSVQFVSCGEEKALTAVSNQPASLSYHEEFDSMARVVEAGWKAVNLSNPLGGESWQQGSYIVNATKGDHLFREYLRIHIRPARMNLPLFLIRVEKACRSSTAG